MNCVLFLKKRVPLLLDIIDLKTPLIGPVNLTIAAGECVALLGPSGSGKSLLLRAIADLDPSEGQVIWKGQKRSDLEAHIWRQKLALIPAESGWWADGVRAHFRERPDPAEMLAAIGLPEALDWQVSHLSTGERHRLAIARALLRDFEVLLLDEPTAALDEQASERVEALIEQQRARGTAILLVTHNREQALRMATRSLVMKNGQLTADDQIDSEEEVLAETWTGSTP